MIAKLNHYTRLGQDSFFEPRYTRYNFFEGKGRLIGTASGASGAVPPLQELQERCPRGLRERLAKASIGYHWLPVRGFESLSLRSREKNRGLPMY